jgi:hypothetical protein
MFLQAPGNEDCFARAKQLAGIMGVAGVPVGFFRAHVTLKVSFNPLNLLSGSIAAPAAAPAAAAAMAGMPACFSGTRNTQGEQQAVVALRTWPVHYRSNDSSSNNSSSSEAAAAAPAGVPVGFFRAHVTLKVSTRGFNAAREH